MEHEHDSTDYNETVRREVAAWKAQPPSVVGSAMSTVLAPIGWLVNQVLPTSVVMGALAGLDWVAKNILTNAGNDHFGDLRECDRTANQVQNFHIGLAAAEGGTAGFFGVVAIPADIAALITLSLRMIRQVGVEYGYSDDNEAERQFCLSVMQGASANTMEEKVLAQVALAEIGRAIATKTWQSMAEKAATNVISKEAGITALRALAKQVGINLTKRKALEAIPFVGSAVGAMSSAWFLRDVGLSAQMAYRERWLFDHDRHSPTLDEPATEHAFA